MSLADLSGTIISLASGTYTVTRYEPATNQSGVRVAGASNTFSIKASVQPITGRDLKKLPEGMRTEELQVLFTPTELKTQGTDSDPDIVTISGESWEVQKVEKWDSLGAYYRAIIAKLGR